MNTKHGIILLCIGLLLFCAFVGTASGKTWYVDDSGGANFTKIQDAINAANESDTIFVYNGTYIEQLTIDKDNLTILGEDRNTTIIDGHGYEGDVVTIGYANCTINGFTIENSGTSDAGIKIVHLCGIPSHHNNISNNIIKNNYEGIYLMQSHNIITENIIFDNNGVGITASSANIISHNVIFSNNGCGVSISSDNNTISDNNVSYNGYYSGYSNIALSGSKNNIISNNTIKCGGIEIRSSCYYNTIINNTILSTYEGEEIVPPGPGSAVYIRLSNHNYVIANTFNKTNGAIGLSQSNYNLIQDNNILNNYRGIEIKESHDNLIYHNNLINNTEQASDDGSNNWDNGSTEGGNYWNNHNCTGNPSNGSQPYVIDADSIDHYPFQAQNGWLFPVIAHFTYSPKNPIINQLITFDASSSTGNITNYEWDFGDGSSATGIIVNHSYASVGNYDVTLTVIDEGGIIDEVTKSISISPRVVYVDDDFEDNPASHRWNTIQEGVDDAIDIDKIVVYDGIYRENIKVNTPNLTIQSKNGSDKTIVQAANSSDHVFEVTADYVNISGFTVKGATKGDEAGIYLGSGVNHCNISDNIASNNYFGIYLYYSSGNDITNNIASNNYNSGIRLYHSSNTLANNTVNSNRHTGIYSCCSANMLINNTINLNGWSGIDLDASRNCTLIGNTVSHNGRNGISLTPGPRNSTLIGNIVSNNGGNGIYLDGGCNNILTDNVVSGNVIIGIYLDYSRNNTLTNNSLLNNLDGGINVDHSNNNKIYLNNFINNTDNVYSTSSTNIWNYTEKITYVYNETIYENYTGNYWSDYKGNDANNDGIGDTPYNIDSDKDVHPLMAPWENYFKPLEEKIFDTGSPFTPYPSIMGNHTGTIKPNHTVIATKLYTYPCTGTGGHTEYARIWNLTWNATATWEGYAGDWHNITFDKTAVLIANETYNYTIRTGSYPQIHHKHELPTENGWINCTEFTDANGKKYYNWIPAIRLE